ncbi:hypothetical protein Tco_0976641 [Tanacetum coccineum]|uniref:Uncharacterized protein n=1 Tax=Tanacetum coccineum TaxID=301880 RepID=A0ABQ5EHT0_9ASTR
MDEQSHYKQDKTITRQSINVKRHIFNVIGGTEEFEERDLNIGGDCLEVGWTRRILVLDSEYWGFLGVGTTFDIFQNIQILYLEYGVLRLSGYGVLGFFSVVFGECRHGYAISPLMDTAYWSLE